MKIPFGKIPSMETLYKLKALRFSTPGQNYKNYVWCKKASDLAEYVMNERNTIIKELGEGDDEGNYRVKKENMEEFTKKMNELFADTTEDLPPFPFKEEDFAEDKCHYSDDDKTWLSAEELGVLFQLTE